MPTTVKCPVPYIGGKYRLAQRIIELLPVKRSCYVEVFGGAGHVITQKPPEPSEVFNDVQSVVVNFFLVLREHPEELLRQIQAMPSAREDFNRLLAWWENGCLGPVSDIDRAARWIFLLRNSFSSIIGNNFGYGRGEHIALHMRRYATLAERLQQVAERWRGIQIEHLDFGDLIPRYDEPRAVFYCDPPYVGCEKYYQSSGFTGKDHARLAKVLSSIKGRAMLSYYPHREVDALYPPDRWRRVSFSVSKASAPTTRGGPTTKPRGTELILMNYGPDGRRLRGAGGKSRR